MDKDTIIAKMYDLMKEAMPIIHNVPRDYKFTLGTRLQNQLLDIQELLIEAYFSPVNKKRAILTKINVRIEQSRYLFRLCFELGLFNTGSFQKLFGKLDEIGRMTGGWLRSVSK